MIKNIPEIFDVEVRHFTDNGVDEFFLMSKRTADDCGVVVWEGQAKLWGGELVNSEPETPMFKIETLPYSTVGEPIGKIKKQDDTD